jgi:surfeit locus 1 family protein
MRIANYDFRPRLLPTIATLCMMVVTGTAGFWQLGRAQEKAQLQLNLEQQQAQPPISLIDYNGDIADLRYRTITVDGEFIAEKQVYIDNREHDGKSGYHVITPLKLAGSTKIVLVNRGWIERGSQYPQAPQAIVPGGLIRISGIGSEPSRRFLELSDEAILGDVWQNLTFDRARSALGLSLLPIIVLQQQPVAPNLSAVTEKPDFKIDMHRGYAFQWFALTATLMVIYVVVNSKRHTA